MKLLVIQFTVKILKLLKTNAAILFNDIYETNKLYYQQLLLKYLCNLVRY